MAATSSRTNSFTALHSASRLSSSMRTTGIAMSLLAMSASLVAAQPAVAPAPSSDATGAAPTTPAVPATPAPTTPPAPVTPAPTTAPVATAPAAANPPQVGSVDNARDLFNKAQDYYLAKDFAKAAEGFKASYNAFPSEAVLYNIASAYEMSGKLNRDPVALQQAVDYYGQYVKASPNATDIGKVTERIIRINGRIVDIQKNPAPTGPQPVLDANGQPVIGPDGKPITQAPPPPAPLAADEVVQARGLIVIESDPGDANDYIDDKKNGLVGHTPWSGAMDGAHRVIIEKRGYVPHEHTMPTSADRLVVYHADLKQDTNLGWVEIKTPGVIGADIYIDSKDDGVRGHTPFAGNLPSGPHTFWISADGYEEYKEVKDVVAGENQTIQTKLKGSPVGYINVRGDGIDESTIVIDGKVACERGPCRKPLTEGEHTLLVRRNDFKPLRRKIQITAKNENTIKVTLAPIPGRGDAIFMYVLTGIFAGGGIYAGNHSQQLHDALQTDIKNGNPPISSNDPRFNQGMYYAIGADAAFGIAGITFLTALYYTFRDKGPVSMSVSDAKSLALTPQLSPGYAGLGMEVRW